MPHSFPSVLADEHTQSACLSLLHDQHEQSTVNRGGGDITGVTMNTSYEQDGLGGGGGVQECLPLLLTGMFDLQVQKIGHWELPTEQNFS